MEYKITLGNDKFVPIRDAIRAGANTKFVFESDEYTLNELQITITNGDFVKRQTIKGNIFDLTQYALKACVLEITVDLILRGTVAKTWAIEPLVVRENGGKCVLIPEFELLRREYRRMKKAICEMDQKIKETM